MQDDRIDLNEIINKLINEYSKTNDMKKALTNILESELKDLEDKIDMSELTEIVNTLYDNAINAYTPNTKQERKEAFINTLSIFDFPYSFSQIKILYKLTIYDKITPMKDIPVFYKLYYLLQMIFNHKLALEYYESLEDESVLKRGIARTKHPKVSEAVEPRYERIAENYEYNPTKSNETQLEIFNQFKDDPLQTNTMLHMVSLFDKNCFKTNNTDALDTVFNQGTFLNSSEKIEDYQIYKSSLISSFLIYKKGSLQNMELSITKHPSNKELANYMNILNQEFFDELFTFKLNRHHINKPIQLRTNLFHTVSIYEFVTDTNKKENPIFKNVTPA